jgi:hypothetical protein
VLLVATTPGQGEGLAPMSLDQEVPVDRQIAASGSPGVLQTLTEYSTGKLPRSVAMKELGLEDYGLLLQLVSAISVPHCIVRNEIRKAMAHRMVAMLNEV